MIAHQLGKTFTGVEFLLQTLSTQVFINAKPETLTLEKEVSNT